jgi:hypothetical protein
LIQVIIGEFFGENDLTFTLREGYFYSLKRRISAQPFSFVGDLLLTATGPKQPVEGNLLTTAEKLTHSNNMH